jgi:hypothetical protein
MRTGNLDLTFFVLAALGVLALAVGLAALASI